MHHHSTKKLSDHLHQIIVEGSKFLLLISAFPAFCFGKDFFQIFFEPDDNQAYDIGLGSDDKSTLQNLDESSLLYLYEYDIRYLFEKQ